MIDTQSITASPKTVQLLRFLAIFALSSQVGFAGIAQTANDYFHTGAKEFIGQQLEQAAQSVTDGLTLAPDDGELLALKDLIEKAKEEQKQQDQQQQEQQEQQEEEDQQQDEEQQDQQQQQDEGEESQQEEQQDQQQQDQGEEESDQQDGGEEQTESDGEGKGEAEPPPAEMDPNDLSREEAERILQALENEEGQLLRQVQKMKVRARRVEKDW